jgi:phosphate transport system substrate-binding protein
MKRTTILTAAAAFGLCAAPAAAQVKLTGAGATFPNIIYQSWILDYNKTHSDVQLNYQSIGSGGGIRQFTDKTIDFGGSDAPMTDEQIAAVQGNVFHIPTVLGAVVITYNLPGVTQQLKFTPAVVADIYLGKLTKWNDARITALNPGVNLPSDDILVVHRSDGSGTTYIWTDYLSKISSEWKGKVGKGTSVNWPVGLGGKGNEGVSATVSQTPGAIGYVELAYANTNKLAYGQLQNASGKFIQPTLAATTAALAGAMKEMGPSTDFRVSITNSPGADAYPIASMTYLLVRKTYDDDPAKITALLKYIWWAETEGQARATALGYAPLPTALRPWIGARLAAVRASGKQVFTASAAR